ncbi:hypothetical protein EXIGLDRAFT_735721 [Exidia glandulosa HHB12029]|uniref:GYF domain-containing protein n=1 Tax=Exidia glandulosa HHB12029 TaxID=1314781 RepID=A0A165PIY7_EXIGL|nr:hypothetical protein EXIGLDRAFT_735721 [Exidia glandulosa HHB12029]
MAAAVDELLPGSRHPDDYDPDADADLTVIPSRTNATQGAGAVPEIEVTNSSPTSVTPSTTPSRRSNASAAPSNASGAGLNRRASQLRRSALDNRAGNRLSGFFSNLFHGDTLPKPSSQPKDSSETPPQTANPTSSAPSRPSTPPPPALPPPSLADLGLALSPITQSLSSTHPSSGTFVAPHYLLLCNAHGLDVLPLAGSGVGAPLWLVRRVPFKSVVVMEERGVLVAIAGRRDAVRVYALEEVRRLIEWRVESEGRKSAKRRTFNLPPVPARSPARPPAVAPVPTGKPPAYTPPVPSLRVSRSNQSMTMSERPGPPVSVQSSHRPSTATGASGTVGRTGTASSLSAGMVLAPRQRQPSVSTIRMASAPSVPTLSTADSSATVTAASLAAEAAEQVEAEKKRAGDWMEDPGSDDEALLAAGPSGSAALDERTSAQARERGVSMDSGEGSTRPSLSGHSQTLDVIPAATATASASMSRPHRPSNLDLSAPSRPQLDASATADPPPSPAPTLLTLRQALQHTLSAQRAVPSHARSRSDTNGVRGINISEDGGLESEGVEDLDDADNYDTDMDAGMERRSTRRRVAQMSLAEALAESRIPGAPPLGSRSGPVARPTEHVSGSGLPPHPAVAPLANPTANMRRRWSVDQSSRRPSVSASVVSAPAPSATMPPATPPPLPTSSSPVPSPTRSNSVHGRDHPRHRFLPRIITAAFRGAGAAQGNGTGYVAVNGTDAEDSDAERAYTSTSSSAVAPKLEFVKLPGTKGAVMVKAVETARKSFLAILCGDAGEKVELFAGTYKTALGLSRTFILPDSPRSLELQLQGDDLVEIFLVFGQNVFGLEPATVRVREVRIGRAERRARRRARQQRDAESGEGPTGTEDEVGVSVTVAVEGSDENTPAPPPPTPAAEVPTPPSPAPAGNGTGVTTTPEEEEQMGPYTTFQQLSFAPAFPLGTIADECIIPPSYPSFVQYKDEWEKDDDEAGPSGSTSITVAVDAGGLTPPGLPSPPSQPPTKWFYIDPKGVVQGPFKGAMMQGWYKDGYLPLDLPIRREGETEYTLLRDLRARSVDPTQPFRPQPIPLTPPVVAPSPPPTAPKPLLPPVSLLKQPKHFGPPALFFSSRGGHSTSIVDARGKSVLKGRLLWSASQSQAGEIRRVEAFDVRDRAVVVALRRSALEAVDVGDALLAPGDESRMLMPDYTVAPAATSRRSPFVWRIGTPLSPPSGSSGHLRSESTPDLVGKPGRHKGDIQLQYALEREMGIAREKESKEWREGKHSAQEEVLFLGREGDNVFFCEKGAGYFRVLRLAPS